MHKQLLQNPRPDSFCVRYSISLLLSDTKWSPEAGLSTACFGSTRNQVLGQMYSNVSSLYADNKAMLEMAPLQWIVAFQLEPNVRKYLWRQSFPTLASEASEVEHFPTLNIKYMNYLKSKDLVENSGPEPQLWHFCHFRLAIHNL